MIDTGGTLHRNIASFIECLQVFVTDRFRVVVLAVLCFSGFAAAQAQSPQSNRAIYLYQGADREARLLAGAKKEKDVVVYSTMTVSDGKVFAEAFERKYGVRMLHWRTSSEKIVSRAVAEARGRRYEADVFESSAIHLEALHRERLLEDFHTPAFAELVPAAFPRGHRQYVADRFAFFVVGYNTRLVKPEELPSGYEALLHPRWAGRIAIEATDVQWFAAVAKSMGEEKGLAYFRRLATLKPEIRASHILTAQLVASGEVPLFLTAYNNNIETLKQQGRAGRLDAAAAGVRPGLGNRRRQERAAPARGTAVHRVRTVARRPGTAEERQPGADQRRGRQSAEQVPLRDHRPGDGDRRGRKVEPAVLAHSPRRQAGAGR